MNIIADEYFTVIFKSLNFFTIFHQFRVKAPLITSKKYSEMLKDVIMAMLEKVS